MQRLIYYASCGECSQHVDGRPHDQVDARVEICKCPREIRQSYACDMCVGYWQRDSMCGKATQQQHRAHRRRSQTPRRRHLAVVTGSMTAC